MYNNLLTQLKEAADFSLSEIANKISNGIYDKQVVDYLATITDYSDFYGKCRSVQTTPTLPFPIIVVLNKLKQMPSSRTSRYL